VQSIDVGCMQVNLMYHPHAFASLEDAFDPRTNAEYAARFLNELYAADRDWAHAIAAYHSETPALGEAYRVLVLARWQNPDLRDTAGPATAYRDFAPRGQAYGAFAPASSVYGAFAPAR
jgi:soluble lytic murein transglycosylase-like protein